MSQSSAGRVLFVDDDPNILDSFRRTFRNHLDFDTAESGVIALTMLRDQGPYAVVVSDQRMPQMSGIQLLREIDRAYPDTVRIMLTGNADQQTAIDAVNNGHIYRFLTKPCPPAAILNAVQDGMRLWGQRQLERELLEGTLSGSVAVLVEIIGRVHPASFGQNQRVRRMVAHVAEKLRLPEAWRFEMAAMLSQIGCVALDADLLARVNAGYELPAEEQALFDSHPQLGARLIRKLPRMEAVGEMITRQFADLGAKLDRPIAELTPEELGGHLLRIALTIDQAMRRGRSFPAALQALLDEGKIWRLDMLHALQSLSLDAATLETKPIRLKELRIGMTLADNIQAENGIVLASGGQIITEMMLERIRAFSESIGLREPMLIQVPAVAPE